ncbi:MFS transporter [Rothia sp. AR01]|uniref:MFS transporter n=1 Tax=Rothia santali TaxID=2949643 RepID=A0A9X2KH54_9MICC|nr:MFS transporter [Rothia santali]MCP3424480.1 MFS transporter [Rothia santali]
MATAYLVVMMDYSIINVALQTIQEDFDASNAQLQWMVSGYEIFYAALLLPAGFLADRYGRNRVLILGLVVFLLGSALMATSATAGQIVTWRVVMGIGGSVVPATTLAIIKHVFPEGRQARAMGVWSAVGGASVAVGPVLGGVLVQGFPWWSVFLINVPIVAACLAVIAKATPESKRPTGARLDVAGILLSTAGVGALVFGLIRGGETGRWAAWETAGTVALGLVLLILLVVVERRRLAPMLDVGLLCHRSFAAGTLSVSLAYFALTGGTFLLVFYIQLVRGQSPGELGLSMLPVAVGAILGALVAGWLMQALGAQATVSGATLLLAFGLGLFGVAEAGTHQAWIEIAFGAAGLGMGITMGATTTLTMGEIDDARAGSGAGLINTIRGVMSIVGIAVLGAVYSLEYRARIGPSLGNLHADLPASADQSLSQTLTAVRDAAEMDADTAAAVLGEAETAFLDAFHLGIWVACGVLALSLLVGMFLLPGKERPER